MWGIGDKFKYEGRKYSVTKVEVERFYQTGFTRVMLRFFNPRAKQMCWVDSSEVERTN